MNSGRLPSHAITISHSGWMACLTRLPLRGQRWNCLYNSLYLFNKESDAPASRFIPWLDTHRTPDTGTVGTHSMQVKRIV